MKKLLLLAAGALLIASTTTLAQKKSQYFSLGPVLGAGHSWLSGVDNQLFKPSAYLGVGLIYSRYEHWGWGADLTASHEGFRMNDVATDNAMSVDPTYLRIVPKAYYFFGRYGDMVRPKIYLAPSLGVKLAEDHYYDNDRLDDAETLTMFNSTNVFKDIDFGLTGGVGVNIQLARSIWLNLDGSYYHGLVDVTDNGNMARNVRMNAGIMFGID